jgi:anaerobic selenocysteine-containing dehydrogenase
MSSQPTTSHACACNLCEAICGLEIELAGDEIVSVRGDRADPFSRGHVCPKAVALKDIQEDPDRLRRPLRRDGSGWVEIGWRQALDEAAGRLRSIRGEHGRDALAVYLGNPNAHNLGALLYGPPLLRTLRTRNRYSATSVDQLPHHLAALEMFGHQLLLPIPDVDRTDFLLMLGANPLASNGSLMTAPGIRRRLRELRRRGGELVVIDPRRTETALVADRHHFIRPGSDALLLLALLQTIFVESLARPGRLAERFDSLDTVRRLATEFPPDRVAAATGVPADEIRQLARRFAAAPSAVCYGRLGVSTQEFGGLCQWLVNALNAVTGNLDRPGGAMFTRPAVDVLASFGRGHLGRWRSRVRGLPEFGGELPAAALAEEILSDEPGRIRALLTLAGNPVLSTPNGAQLERALGRLDFMLSVDLYLNETSRHADLILPPTAPLERDHYDLVFNLLAVRNTAKFSPALLAPPAGALHDWQILDELHRRLADGPLRARLKRAASRLLGPRRLLDLGLRLGPYGGGLNPFAGGLTLARLAKAVHGMDLGPLEPCLPARLYTPGKRIELAPELFVADLERLRRRLHEPLPAAAGTGELLLIGRRDVRSNNSWMHNFPRLMRGRDRCTLLMHPRDAARLGLEEAERVAVVSRTGRVTAPLEISDRVMPGVVSLPHGWGHGRDGTRLATANAHPGASLNDLTDDLEVDQLCGTAALNGIAVHVEAAPAATG